MPGPYKLAALGFESTAAITNKASYVAYRGPWASETFVRERVLDLIAKTSASIRSRSGCATSPRAPIRRP